MAALAQGLMVVRVPEQFGITTMGNDVIGDHGQHQLLPLLASHAPWELSKAALAVSSPCVVIELMPFTPAEASMVRRIPLLDRAPATGWLVCGWLC